MYLDNCVDVEKKQNILAFLDTFRFDPTENDPPRVAHSVMLAISALFCDEVVVNRVHAHRSLAHRHIIMIRITSYNGLAPGISTTDTLGLRPALRRQLLVYRS